jgi:two-component system sensor histidine kinase UhpB
LNDPSFRFLLIEPDPASRTLVHQALDGGNFIYQIDEAADDATLDTLLHSPRRYDVVMMGLRMNGHSGPDLVDQVTGALPTTPIVLLTRPGETSTAASLMQHAGVGDYVLKTREHLRMLPAILLTVLDHAAAQRAAHEAEQRFKRMAENAPDMIFRWSYARGFEYVNPASTEVVGYTPEEHYADPGLGYRVIHPDDIPAYESVFSDFADPLGARRYVVIRWFHKDGHVVHVEMRMTPIFDETGELVAIEGISRDISQHVIARERLRELTVRITQAQEDERRRLARDLHDDVGQALTIMKMRLGMAEKALPEDSAAREKLDVLKTLLDDTLQTVRGLSHELRPPLLDELGWDAALSWLCDSFSQRTSIPVSYQRIGDIQRLHGDVELTAYRVVQEALTNTARHANADLITVRAAMDETDLVLIVQDDGAGFDIEALQRSGKSSLGLLGMQERVDTVGGSVEVTSTPGHGTQITAKLPLTYTKEEPSNGTN